MARTGYLTRAVHFSASHRYYRPDWSDEENRRRFGDAASPEPHTHDYRCEITVCGPIDPDTGMVVDLARLDRILDATVIARFDRRDIKERAEGFRHDQEARR